MSNRVYRTPEERFARLPGFTHAPHYVAIDGLRMHYVDVGPRSGRPVVLLHGEPTWSYLYRHMIEPLAAAGYRVLAPDFSAAGVPTSRGTSAITATRRTSTGPGNGSSSSVSTA